MRREIGAIIFAVGLAIPALCFHAYAGAAKSTSSGILLGVYDGNQGFDMPSVMALEKWQGKKNAVVNMYTNWCSQPSQMQQLFATQLPAIWANGNVPLVTWELFLGNIPTPKDILAQIANGQYDSYIAAWVNGLKTFLSGPDKTFGTVDDRRVYIRLGHEMNGNWYPWSAEVGSSCPADFIAMWSHVRNIFKANGIGPNHAQWVWCVNNVDVGDFAAEEYFPGDENVDWVAVDGYNWGASQAWSNWQSPVECFDDMVSRLRAISRKPLALAEHAATSKTIQGNDPISKGQWITDLFSYAAQKQFKMVVTFNKDKETNWAIFGGQYGTITYGTKNAYIEYKRAVTNPVLASSDLKNARLITQAQFTGNW